MFSNLHYTNAKLDLTFVYSYVVGHVMETSMTIYGDKHDQIWGQAWQCTFNISKCKIIGPHTSIHQIKPGERIP